MKAAILCLAITIALCADQTALTDAQQKNIWKVVAEARGKALDVRTAEDILQQKRADSKTAEDRANAAIKEACPSGHVNVDEKTGELQCAPETPPPAK